MTMTRAASVDTRPCLAFVSTASHSLAPLLVMLHPMTRVASVDTTTCLAFVCTASHSLAPLLVMLHPMTRAASVDTGTRPSYSRGPGSRGCRGCHLIRRSTSQDSAACGRYSQNLGVSVSRRHQQWIKMSWVQSVWLAGPRSRPPSLQTCIHAYSWLRQESNATFE